MYPFQTVAIHIEYIRVWHVVRNYKEGHVTLLKMVQ